MSTYWWYCDLGLYINFTPCIAIAAMLQGEWNGWIPLSLFLPPPLSTFLHACLTIGKARPRMHKSGCVQNFKRLFNFALLNNFSRMTNKFWIWRHFFHCDLFPKLVLVCIWFSLIYTPIDGAGSTYQKQSHLYIYS